jgi:hypothetical protein
MRALLALSTLILPVLSNHAASSVSGAQRALKKKLNNVENSMMKMDLLINSPSSPVVSTLKQTQKYNGKDIIE